MTNKHFCLLLICLLGVALFSGCEAEGEHAGKPGEAQRLTQYPVNVGGEVVNMELAVTGQQQRIGLMYRDEMAEDAGMLFLYKEPQRLDFWMKNTRIPLDIGFFDSRGALREVYQMEPYDMGTTSSRSQTIQYALEMNEGWFDEHGVEPGAVLNLQMVARALVAEGVEPALYGIDFKPEDKE